jgi:threonine dehydrogenase-like Zn-dependent dehydrogenase
VILKVVATNICGSDQHMVRGRTTAPEGLILGHEITGEIVEAGRDVEYRAVGGSGVGAVQRGLGRCRNCKERRTDVCLYVNDHPGGAYGYVDMDGWRGGQAEYVMVPYADWNTLKFADRDRAMEKMLDLTMITDTFPAGTNKDRRDHARSVGFETVDPLARRSPSRSNRSSACRGRRRGGLRRVRGPGPPGTAPSRTRPC